VTAILGGIIYYQLADKEDGACTFSQKNKQNISTAAFYAVSVMTLNNVLAAALTFPLEIPIFLHEVFKYYLIVPPFFYSEFKHRTLVYRCDAYYLSKVLSEVSLNSFFYFKFH
jgi:hypothetical protein